MDGSQIEGKAPQSVPLLQLIAKVFRLPVLMNARFYWVCAMSRIGFVAALHMQDR